MVRFEISTATMLERRVIRLRANALGVQWSSRAPFITRERIAGEALAPGLKQCETADCETPARNATS